MAETEVKFVIKADTASGQAEVAKLTAAMEKMGSQGEQSGKKTASAWDQTFSKMQSAGTAMTAALTLPIAGLAAMAIKSAGSFEQTTIAMTTLLGSGQKAQAFLAELKDFAAKTPFEFEDLTRASRKMLALGFAAKDVLPMMRIIGDAVSGLGGGAEMIDRVTLALGQMQAKGKVSAQEMNQLAEAGIGAWGMLAKQIGVSIPEAMKMAENGAISASVAIPAILAGMDAKFKGGMEAQMQSFLGQVSNMKDKLFFALIEVGNALLPFAKTAVDVLSKIIAHIIPVAEAFGKLPGPVQVSIVAFAGLLAAAGPLLAAIGFIGTGITNLITVGGALLPVLTSMKVAILGIQAVTVAWVAAIGAAVVAIGWIAKASHDAAKAQDELRANEQQTENAVYRTAAALKARGIEVQRGNMTLDQWAVALGKAYEANKKEIDAQAQAEHATKKTTAAKKELTDEQKKWMESAQKALKPAQELERELQFLARQGMASKDIMRAHKDEIIKAAEATRAMGGVVPKLVSELEKEARAENRANVEFAFKYEIMKKMISSRTGYDGLIEKMGQLRISSADLMTGIRELNLEWGQGTEQLIADQEKLDAKFRELGTHSKFEMVGMANAAEKNYKAITASGQASVVAQLKAWIVWQETLKEVAKEGYGSFTKEQQKALDAANKKLAGFTGEGKAEVLSFADFMRDQFKEVFNDLTKAIANLVINWKGGWSNMLNIAKEFGMSILRFVIGQVLFPLQQKLQGLFSGSGGAGGTSGILGGLLGGGGALGALGIAGAGIAGGISLGGRIGGTAGGAIGGAIAGFSGLAGLGGLVAASAGTSILGGMGAGLMAAFTNPLSAAIVGLAAGIGILISKIGGGRKQADQIVPVQNELTAAFGKVLDEVNAARENGTLTVEVLDLAITKVQQMGSEFFRFAAQFDKAGPQAIRDMTALMNRVIESLSQMKPEVIQKAIDNMDAAISAFEEQMAGTLTQIIDKLNGEIRQTEQNIVDLTNGLTELDTQMQEARDALADTAHWQERYNELISGAAQAAAAAQQRVADSQARIIALESQINEARLQGIVEVGRAAQDVQNRALAARDRVGSLEKQVAEDRLLTIIETSKNAKEVEAAQKALDAMRKQATMDERAAREKELADLKAQLPALEAAAKAAQAAINEGRAAEAELTRLAAERQQAERTAREAELKALKEGLPGLIAQADAAKKAFEAAKVAAAAQIEAEKENLRQFLAAGAERREEILKQINQQKEHLAGLKALRDEAQAAYDALGISRRTEEQDIRATIAAMQAYIQALRDQRAAMAALLAPAPPTPPPAPPTPPAGNEDTGTETYFLGIKTSGAAAGGATSGASISAGNTYEININAGAVIDPEGMKKLFIDQLLPAMEDATGNNEAGSRDRLALALRIL